MEALYFRKTNFLLRVTNQQNDTMSEKKIMEEKVSRFLKDQGGYCSAPRTKGT